MEKMADGNGTTYEFPYYRTIDDRSGWDKFKTCCYDPKDGSYLGRTPASWAKIGAFYLCFYAVLAGLFAICVQGLISTLNTDYPKWQLNSSLIGTNPGLGFRPLSNRTEEGSLIWYDAKDAEAISRWVKFVDDFLIPYRNKSVLPGGGRNQVPCDFQKAPPLGKVCAVDVYNFGPCTSEKNYGYNNSAPCAFLKLNRIYAWEPDYYDDPNDLPKEMPVELKQKISMTKPEERKQIWVSCTGENPADRENLGEVEFFPTTGFQSYFYPFKNQEGYLSPLVAVQFKRPALNRLINIECRAWAKNIQYSGSNKDRKGSVHFEIMVD